MSSKISFDKKHIMVLSILLSWISLSIFIIIGETSVIWISYYFLVSGFVGYFSAINYKR